MINNSGTSVNRFYKGATIPTFIRILLRRRGNVARMQRSEIRDPWITLHFIQATQLGAAQLHRRIAFRHVFSFTHPAADDSHDSRWKLL
jgi:hypothetical protein